MREFIPSGRELQNGCFNFYLRTPYDAGIRNGRTVGNQAEIDAARPSPSKYGVLNSTLR